MKMKELMEQSLELTDELMEYAFKLIPTAELIKNSDTEEFEFMRKLLKLLDLMKQVTLKQAEMMDDFEYKLDTLIDQTKKTEYQLEVVKEPIVKTVRDLKND